MANQEKWLESYKKNKKRIDRIYQFVSDNIDTYNKFNKTTTLQIINKAENNRKLIIYYSFLDSINAVSRTNLQNIGDSMEKFVKKLDTFDFSNTPINFIEFIKHFNHENINIDDFFNNLKQEYDGLGYKTTSLFVRELHLANFYSKSKLFDVFDYDKFSYKIALDIVIATVFNNLLGLENNKIDNTKDFNIFHDFIDGIKYDKGIVESFWFWGYFNRNSQNGNKIGFNEQKYFANPYFYPGDGNEFKEKLEEFGSLFKNV